MMGDVLECSSSEKPDDEDSCEPIVTRRPRWPAGGGAFIVLALVLVCFVGEQLSVAGERLQAAGQEPDSSASASASTRTTRPTAGHNQRMARSDSRLVASSAAARFGGNSIWADLDGWRRNKRDIEDRIVLASRRAGLRQRRRADDKSNDDDFEVDDGNEDAWVHDGVDDIHIDPETKRAASELSRDEASIDAEYEPQGGGGGGGGGQEGESQPVANRTRITTIQEVIPMNTDELDSGSLDRDHQHRLGSVLGSAASVRANSGPLLPASYLTLGQVQQLLESQRRTDNEDDDEEEEAPAPQTAEESRRPRPVMRLAPGDPNGGGGAVFG
jgi:hypothetical protein